MYDTHALTQAVDNSFRRGDQFRGSSGSLDGVGIRTMSLCFPRLRWRVSTTCSRSTRVTVPGTADVSILGGMMDRGIPQTRRDGRSDIYRRKHSVASDDAERWRYKTLFYACSDNDRRVRLPPPHAYPKLYRYPCMSNYLLSEFLSNHLLADSPQLIRTLLPLWEVHSRQCQHLVIVQERSRLICSRQL